MNEISFETPSESFCLKQGRIKISGVYPIPIRPCLLTGKTKKFSEITFMFIGSTIKGFSLCPIFFYISKNSIAPLEAVRAR
jgi:hypothetical protein